jgi:hypothetical protein
MDTRGVKSWGAAWALVLVCVAMLQPGCEGGAPSDEQQVTDTVEAYRAALLDGDGKTACGYVTATARRRFGGHDRSGSRISCARQVGYLHRDPGFLRVGKDLSVTHVTVHGRKAKAHAESPSKAVVTADYGLVKKGGQWKIAYIFSTS